jgi:hypothetical protein
MTGMVWELLVVGLLLYGVAFLGIAAVYGRRQAEGPVIPDAPEAPIFVTRRSSGATSSTVTTRTGTTQAA